MTYSDIMSEFMKRECTCVYECICFDEINTVKYNKEGTEAMGISVCNRLRSQQQR